MPARRGETGRAAWHQGSLAVVLPPSETYHPGVDLTSQGKVAPCVYYVVEGAVKLTHVLPDGRE